jgi:hypothetical protein
MIFCILAVLFPIWNLNSEHKNASCESVSLSNQIGNSHFQSGRIINIMSKLKESPFNVKIKCPCGNYFYANKKRLRYANSKYCSSACQKIASRVERIERICGFCEKSFYITRKAINHGEGKYCSRRCSGKNKKMDDSNNWRGDNAGYVGKHLWIKNNFGKAHKCEMCHSLNEKKYEWASIGHTYIRNINDWIQLCSSCHRIFDGQSKGIIKCDENNKIIEEYLSTKIAARSLGVPKNTLISAIKRNGIFKWFYWMYKT